MIDGSSIDGSSRHAQFNEMEIDRYGTLLASAVLCGAAQAEPLNVSTANFAPTLTRGDLVRLRSGGPLMTVMDVKGDTVDCIWTGDDGDPRDGTFPLSC